MRVEYCDQLLEMAKWDSGAQSGRADETRSPTLLPADFPFRRGHRPPLISSQRLLVRPRLSCFSLNCHGCSRSPMLPVSTTLISRHRLLGRRLLRSIMVLLILGFSSARWRRIALVLRRLARLDVPMAGHGASATQSTAVALRSSCRGIRTVSCVSSSSWCGCRGCRNMRERR